MVNEIVIKIDNDVLQSKLDFIPSGVALRFGCLNKCEWYGSEGHECYTEFPVAKICSERLMWLASYMPDYDTKPSLSRFMLDINKALVHEQQMQVRRILDMYWKQLDKAMQESSPDEKKLEGIKDNLGRYLKRWESLIGRVIHYEDLQETRDKPKKSEVVIHRDLTPFEFGKLINIAKERVKELDNE